MARSAGRAASSIHPAPRAVAPKSNRALCGFGQSAPSGGNGHRGRPSTPRHALGLGHEAGQAARHCAADAGDPHVRGDTGPVVRHADRPTRSERRQLRQHGRRREAAGGHRRLQLHLGGQRAHVRGPRPDLHEDHRVVGQGDGHGRPDAEFDGGDAGSAETLPGHPVRDHSAGGLEVVRLEHATGEQPIRGVGPAFDHCCSTKQACPDGAGCTVILHRTEGSSVRLLTSGAAGQLRPSATERFSDRGCRRLRIHGLLSPTGICRLPLSTSWLYVLYLPASRVRPYSRTLRALSCPEPLNALLVGKRNDDEIYRQLRRMVG